MHHTISNIDKTINLQQYIDNRKGDKCVGLKSIIYGLGWYNIPTGIWYIVGIRRQGFPTGGYYSFQQLSDYFIKDKVILSVNETNGFVTVTTTPYLHLSEYLSKILGFGDKTEFQPNETYTGTKHLDLAIYKSLYVHLEQINTSYNYLDGRPSTLLAVIPVENKEFGEIMTMRLEHPEYKRLITGTISELKIEIRDENNNKIINNLSTSCVLEIISK